MTDPLETVEQWTEWFRAESDKHTSCVPEHCPWTSVHYARALIPVLAQREAARDQEMFVDLRAAIAQQRERIANLEKRQIIGAMAPNSTAVAASATTLWEYVEECARNVVTQRDGYREAKDVIGQLTAQRARLEIERAALIEQAHNLTNDLEAVAGELKAGRGEIVRWRAIHDQGVRRLREEEQRRLDLAVDCSLRIGVLKEERDALAVRLEDSAKFLDFTVREWLGMLCEHTNCAIDSGCSHGAAEREMYEHLDAALAALREGEPDTHTDERLPPSDPGAVR